MTRVSPLFCQDAWVSLQQNILKEIEVKGVIQPKKCSCANIFSFIMCILCCAPVTCCCCLSFCMKIPITRRDKPKQHIPTQVVKQVCLEYLSSFVHIKR